MIGVGKGLESIALALYNVISKVLYKSEYHLLDAPAVTMTVTVTVICPS
jgi:hypothetical protein